MKIELKENCWIESIDSKHSLELYKMIKANSDYLQQWLPWVNKMESIDFINEFITNSIKRSAEGTELAFVIFWDNILIGRIGIYKIDNQNKIGEIGYWISQKMQGKGIITKSCIKLIDVAFNQLHLNRIEIKCATENNKSQAIPIRLDFKLDGIIRQGELVHDNFVDLNLYSILKEDWTRRI